MITYVAIIILLIFLCIIALFCFDKRYKQTNCFKNQHIELADYIEGVPESIDIAVFGSTYALYGFQSLHNLTGKKSFNFSLNAESLELDRQLLQKYIRNIRGNGGIVLFVLAPCVCYYRYSMSNKYNAYCLLNKKDIQGYRWIDNFKYHHPLIFNGNIIKNIIHIFIDKPQVQSLDQLFSVTISTEDSVKNMKNMAQGWMKMFNLNNLKVGSNDETNISNLSFNADVLSKMINVCKEKGAKAYFVIPPFSKELNKYFDMEFLEEGLYKMLRLANPEGDVPVLDYRLDNYFQNNISLYADGGFRLNKEGSSIFCKKIIRNLSSKANEEAYK